MQRLSKQNSIVMVLVLVLVMVVVVGCSGVGAAPAAGGGGGYLPMNSITVSGVGEATGTPDIAYINLGVSVINEDVGEAVTESNALMQQVKDAILALDIAEED